MKKTFTLIASILFTVIMYAYPTQSAISISSNSNSSLRVIIDGNNYSTRGNSLLVNNLNVGYHTIKIYQMVNHRNNNNFNNNFQLIYNSGIYLKAMYHVDISINRFGKIFVDEQPVNIGYFDMDDDDCTNNFLVNNQAGNPNNNWNNNGNNSNNNWNNNGNSQNNNWNGWNNNTNQVMNNQSFDRFKVSLRNESFDNTKMMIAKQVIASNYFTTSQVSEILQQFSFENNKLEMAKFAYKYTVDKNNYFTIANAFTFSSSKEELIRYMQQNP